MKYLFSLLLLIVALSSCEQEPEIIGVETNKQPIKYDVCHYDAATDAYSTLSVPEYALQSHLKHGDELGICSDTQTYVPDPTFEYYLIKKGYDDVLDHYVITENIVNVTEIMFTDPEYGDLCEDYSSPCLNNLIGIEDFISLKELWIENAYAIPIDNLDLSKNINLETIWLENLSNLTSLNLTKNVKLKSLSILFTPLENLNLKKNINLEVLGLRATEIAILDISENKKLKGVEVGENNFGKIDLSNCPELIILHIWGNQFESLDVTNNTKLNNIYLSDQILNQVDYSKNLELGTFSLNNCSFDFVDLSLNTNINSLGFRGVTVTSINLSNGNNTFIEFFNAGTDDNNNIGCIQVDDLAYSLANWPAVDPTILSEDCGY